MQNKNRGRFISLLFLGLMLVSMLSMLRSGGTDEAYSAVLEQFRQNKVDSFTMDVGTGELTYHLKGEPEGQFETHDVPVPSYFREDVAPYIEAYNAKNPTAPLEYTYTASSDILSLLINYLPTILLVGVMFFFLFSMSQQGGGKIGNIGKARTKVGFEDGRHTTFEDVAGAHEEKEELKEIVDYLKDPTRFNKLGAKIPKGVLLVGPPGTGKTLLARAVAGEAGVPFYSISGSDFVELYVGVGASRVRDVFDKAKKTRPSILFIDEIDAVGRQRGAGMGGGNDEREQTLNQLLVEMDGFSGNEGVIVMAATNRADVLDRALLRPGRFDRQIYVGVPDVREREEILKVHSRGKPLAPDVELETVAKSTPGFTGADLENLLNEAALLAARKDRKAIVQDDIEEATIKVIAGPEKKSKVVIEKERELTAYHEAGHAVAHYYATPDQPVHQISIIPRGMAGGYTLSLPDEDRSYSTKGMMRKEIVTLLGGRVAEQIVLDDISTGASNDLSRVTATARAMVTRYGFSEKVGPIVYDERDEVFLGRDFVQSRSYSEQVATNIDAEIKAVVEEAYKECETILMQHRDQLERVARALLEKETLDGETFKAIMEGDSTETPAEEQV